MADLTEEGFALIASVYRGDRQEHPRSARTVAGAQGLLASRNWLVQGRSKAYHTVVMWFRKSSTSTAGRATLHAEEGQPDR